MPTLLHTKADKEAAINSLRRLLQDYLFHGTSPTIREQIITILAWYRDQPNPMLASCKFEYDDKLGITRVTFELAPDGKA